LRTGLARADDPPENSYETELPSGRYSISIQGMLCTVCAKAITAQWTKLPEVKSAAIDFNRERAIVSVRLNKTLPVDNLRASLVEAQKVSNLGVQYEIGRIEPLR
jgi:copper chaperone CopZ